MSAIRMSDVTSEQRRRAFDLAKREVGVANVHDTSLTPLALFLLAAVAQGAVTTIVQADAEGREVRP